MGLGCMRLPMLAGESGLATIATAIELGVRFFDTARAYGDNEALVGRALQDTHERVTLITKCGMRSPEEPGGRWIADGRASSILRDAAASREMLGRAPDLLLLHAPDPRVPLATSVRALVRARERGLTRAIGLSNVTRKELDALDPNIEIAAVEVALGAYDDAAARGGVVLWCKAHNVPLLAHSPLGGPTRAPKLERDTTLRAIASRQPEGTTPAMVVLRYLLHVADVVVPIVGARRPASVRSAVDAEQLVFADRDLDLLDARFPGLGAVRRPPPRPTTRPSLGGDEVIVLMGLVGSGKSLLAKSYVDRGYTRLNRDLIGGTLKGLAGRLGTLLAQPRDSNNTPRRFVLDNTYVTRASRSDVVRVAHAAGATVKCIFIDTSSADSQINCTTRMLERHGELLGGAELALRAKTDANLFMPNTLFRMEKMLERPSHDEGFDAIEVLPFTRRREEGAAPARASVLLPIDFVFGENPKVPLLQRDALARLAEIPQDTPVLVFGWRPHASGEWRTTATELLGGLTRPALELAVCDHAAGPPTCWCRPPLPGLFVAFARKHDVDPRLSLILPTSAAHRAMARHLGLTVLT